MSVPPLSHDFATDTLGSAPSGFDAVTAGITVTTDQGFPAAKFPDPTAEMRLDWHGFGSLTSNVFFREIIWIPGIPTTNRLRPLQANDNASVISGAFEILTSTGFARAHSQTLDTDGSIQVPLASWFRVEMRVLPSATVGEVEVRWWSNPDSAGTPTETLLGTATNTSTNVDGINYGPVNSFPTPPYTIHVRHTAVSTAGWIGPVPSGAVPLPSWPRVRFNG